MRLKKATLQRLATNLVTSLISKQLLQPKVDTHQLIEAVATILIQNMEEERAIEDETRKLMERYRSQIDQGHADPQRLYMMIKKQVAKEKKFIL